MHYGIYYQKAAKSELQESQDTYGAGYREETNAWLNQLATEAARKDQSLSLDLKALAEAALASEPRSWPYSWRRWLSSPLLEKFKALLVTAKKRCPPWELRAAAKRFTVVNAFDCDIMAYFEVDHVLQRIIFRHFDGLPGQE